jgi:rhomboid protease GluP
MDTRSLLDIGSPGCEAMALLGVTSGPRLWVGHGWTLLTAGVLHRSLLHIGFNLYFLRSFGAKAHGLLGPARTLVLFFLSSIGGFLVSDLLSGAPTAGASAGLFGLLGGMAVFGYRRGGTLGAALNREMLVTAGMVTVYSLLMGGVNHWAHGGGMAFGALIALGFPKHEGKHEGRTVQLLAVALTLATIGAVAFNVWHTLQGNRLAQMCG